MLIAVLNQSKLVQNADVNTMCQAIQIQLDLHFMPAWDLKNATVKFYAEASQVPGYAWIISLIDNDTNVPGALGYHQESGDKVSGFIMAEPILSNGGALMVFDAANPGQYTVSATLSHEVLEAVCDRFTNSYCDNGGISWALEVADPVEQIGYPIEVNGVAISMSDFVFPNFFNPQATLSLNAPFNYLNTVKAPFSILEGGYAIQRAGGPGTEQQVFGRSVPQWRRDTKAKKTARAQRRIWENVG